MKNSGIIIFCVSILVACAKPGEHFFVENKGTASVHLDFEFIENHDEPDSTRIRYSNDPFVFVSNQRVSQKVIRQFPFKANECFDTLRVNALGGVYHLNIEPSKIIVIPPVYTYSQNVGSFVIDGEDSLHFTDDQPGIDEIAVYYNKWYKRKQRIVGANYRFLELNKDSIHRVLNESGQ